jgi:hypothetical protein
VAGLDIDALERVGSREPPFVETVVDDSRKSLGDGGAARLPLV